jgi:hypothetical protein
VASPHTRPSAHTPTPHPTPPPATFPPRYTKTEFRKEGATAGTYDSYFFSPAGKRFRSRAEIARYFSLDAAPPARGNAKSAETKAAEKAAVAEAKEGDREAQEAATKKALAYARRFPVADCRLPYHRQTDPPLPPLPPLVELNTSPLPPSRTGDMLQVTLSVLPPPPARLGP